MAITPKNLLKRHKLPLAAHLHTPTAPPGLDLSRPLLLYNTYNSTKVRGVSLRPGKNGELTPVGPTIVIPDSYTGWFAVVTSDGHTAAYYNTVEQVASSQVSFFLTRYDVPAFTNKHDENGGLSYQKTVVQSGHVLKLLGIYEDLNARRTNSGGRGRDMSSSSSYCDKYAQCLNYRNEVVFLPFSASGRFYTTAHKSSKNPNHVYLMTQILKNHRLPLTVRLVCGYMPRVPCNFTGVLRLEQAQKEAVILACTMTNEADATLFEIDVSSNFALTPVKDTMFPKAPIFLKTVSYCDDEAEAWRRQIKVTHHVTEKRSRSLTRSLSDKFVEPFTNVRPLSLSFLSDHDRRKVRERDHSREGRLPPTNKDKSRELRFRDFRRRENSVEKTKFTYHDRSSSLNNYPIKDSGLENKKNADIRKISKQNTYVLQNGKNSKQVEKKVESESSSFLSTASVENMDYSRVVDDISPIPEKEEEGESHYAEICDFARRAGSSSRFEGPLSLPNLSLFQRAVSKKEEKLSRKISSNISSLSNISLRSNGSARKQIRRSSSGTPSETGSRRSSARVSESSSKEDSASIKERDPSDSVGRVYRQEMQREDRLCDVVPSSVFEKDKDNEVYSHEVSKREKLKEMLSAEFKRSKECGKSLLESDKWDKLKRLSRRGGDKDKSGKISEQEVQGVVKCSSPTTSEAKTDQMIGKDKVNEVYIIRVVVKDKEEDQMSTLARDTSGGYYMKIRGFEVPKEEIGRGVVCGGSDEISGYDSLC
ncbi:hypothetical protein Pcinc_039543 [Petrolisthes cinctipes]|uniref:CABIT domain-containing protein n=1 Tax=Petrolisthes cinctipes TaxID=88211 RepID=A0AAE1BNG4_PETCI|nr:hypothetical protein Pcinc_039543 [Petrolisthes cinctipes]